MATLDALGITDLREVGRGATSTVYAAMQEQYARDVAVKVFSTPLVDEKSRRRFERECQTLGRLSGHPNVVNLFGSGYDDEERPFIVMELCLLGSLQQVLTREGPMPVPEVLRIGVKTCSALALAHANGVTHRDIKPANVLLTALGEPVLSDFGISSNTGAELSWTVGESLTPLYAAPEVLESGGGSVQSDVWSLTSTLYAMLLGHAPFANTTSSLVAMITRITRDSAPPLDRADVPHELTNALNRGMAKAPGDRFESARDLAMALQTIQRGAGLAITEYLDLRPTSASSVGAKVDNVAPEPERASDHPSNTPADLPLQSVAVTILDNEFAGTTDHTGLRGNDLLTPATTIHRFAVQDTVTEGPDTTALTDPELSPTSDIPAGEEGQGPRNRRLLVAAAAALCVAIAGIVVGVVASWGGTNTPHASPPTTAFSAPEFATRCKGLRCSIDLSSSTTAAMAHAEILRVSFGDGSNPQELTRPEGLSYKYTHGGTFTVSASLTKGSTHSPATTETVTLKTWKPTIAVTAANQQLTIRLTPKQCAAGRYLVEQHRNRGWKVLGGSRKIPQGGVTHLRVSPGRYRIKLSTVAVAGGGVCTSAHSASHTVKAPTAPVIPSTNTHPSPSGGSTSQPRQPVQPTFAF